MRRTPFFQKPLPYSYYYATIILIAFNVLVFAIQYLAPNFFNSYMNLDPKSGNPNYFGLITNLTTFTQRPWTLVTYLFIHYDIFHIGFNMIALLVFGMAVEQKMGSNEFLLFYFFSGILSGVLLCLVYPLLGLRTEMIIGASGAIYAVMLAYATFFPYSTLLIWGIIPVKAYILVLVLLAIAIISTVFGWMGDIAHLGHLAGALFGFIYFPLRLRINPIKEIIYTRRYYQ
jgi:membrane associated rhomboid family serine protease